MPKAVPDALRGTLNGKADRFQVAPGTCPLKKLVVAWIGGMSGSERFVHQH